MILPPGETDKHLFDLEAACKALDDQMKEKFTLTTDTVANPVSLSTSVQFVLQVYEDDKYEKRREMLRKIFRAVDKNKNN